MSNVCLSRRGSDRIAPPPCGTITSDVTRLDPRRLARGLVLLPFPRLLRGARTLGIGVARGTRAGEDVSAGADSDRCRFPPFSAWQLRRNHFAAAIGLAPSGRISGNLRRHRCRASPHIDPPVARGPRNGPAVSPTASSAAPTRLMRIRRAMISRRGARTLQVITDRATLKP